VIAKTELLKATRRHGIFLHLHFTDGTVTRSQSHTWLSIQCKSGRRLQ
jgi:hypothetical protein